MKPLLVTNNKGDALKPDVASEISSVIRRDKGEDATETPTSAISDGGASYSDTTLSSTASLIAEAKSRNLSNKLCGLQTKLLEAKARRWIGKNSNSQSWDPSLRKSYFRVDS